MNPKKLSQKLKSNQSFISESFLEETLTSLKLKGVNFIDCGFSKITWKDSLIQGFSFSDCKFNKNKWNLNKIENCQFSNCSFIENLWENVNFTNCTFVNCSFKKAVLNNCAFTNSLVDSANFIDECTWSGTLKDTKFLRGKWLKTTLQWSEVSGSHLYLTDFKDKNFPWAKAQGTVFDDCNMGECDFSNLTLTNLTFSDCQFDLLNLTKSTPLNVDFIESRIKKVIAPGLNAEYLQMGRTNIDAGNFEDITLTMASVFTEAKLTNISYNGSKMGMAVFEKANIENCTFENADFQGFNLADAKLKNVSFNNAEIKNLHLSDTIKDNVIGLD